MPRPPQMLPQRNSTRTLWIPPPEGLNVADGAANLAPTDATVLKNLVRGERGLRPRLGSIEHAIGLGGEVRTLIPYAGSSSDGTKDRLFAVTVEGIWNVSTSTPSLALGFADRLGDAGWGSHAPFTTAAGKFIAYCDEANGYCLYTESTDTWAAVAAGSGAGQVDGIDPATFAHVCVWKKRLWFTPRDSDKAWYLGLDSIAGTATSFNFGRQFRSGGSLVGLYSWTGDGGAGLDDHLVAIGSGGDVVIYAGTDPADSGGFAMRGVWSAGALPAGRRIATSGGGDLLLLTSRGLLPVSILTAAGEKLDQNAYTTRKIAPLVSAAMSSRRSMLGWDLRQHPGDNALLILVPKLGGDEHMQYAMSETGKGWSVYQGLPALCADSWRGEFYFGTADGKVCKAYGYADGMTAAGAGSTAIPWAYVSAYSDLGSPQQKRVEMIRPEFSTDGNAPTWTAAARYDLDLSDPADLAYVAGTGGWDSGLWGTATWAADPDRTAAWIGATGMGRFVALEVRGSSVGSLAYTGASVVMRGGGVL